ncbi:DUF4160 domain-containing protein [Francisella tularensis]|uniref:DUF4160 domain-containing protein n=1 Tax=Francisella tularensis TaxID=263 RepID=UPI0008F467D8|nr:DUF4160 domain-containing protein [Francisella tularensis]APA83280.1 hypothetical protein N894_1296 [Francisella tularensis subsp. novicida PA10-7858]
MPTILRIGAYRFFFYSNENNEPAHIHIQKDNCLAKFWLNPVTLSSSTNFNSVELRKLNKLVSDNKQLFKEKWNEYFA